MSPSKPVRVVTHDISDPVRIVTDGISDPVRIVTDGRADPVRIVTEGVSDPIRIVAGVWPPIQPHFDFNPALISFTPGMAKRAMSIFAAAPIVQGKRDGTGTPDIVTLSRGNLVAGSAFYNNFDSNQGTVTFLITPEWNGNDGVRHDFPLAHAPFMAYKTVVAGILYVTIGGQLAGVGVGGWVAGNRYAVTIRWDCKNTLDGTNYICISIDDVHTFGATTAPTITVPDALIYLGSNQVSNYPANAIIEGLTIYRRVLWDGTYGTDVGNGDEVAQIAAGVDPTTVTGSWDVCFCLPTNATPGALVTGTGEAWSHPHSSNLIPPIDGFMADTAWNNWTASGIPINPAVLTTAEKIYSGGYKFENDAAWEGYLYLLTGLTIGSDYVLRALAHSDGVGQPTIVIYDETNAAVISAIFGTTTSTKEHPDILMFSFELPTIARGAVADCTSISIRILNLINAGVVAWHQVELLPNLLDNPSFDTGAVADPWIPDGFNNVNLAVGDTEKEIAITHSGGASWQWNIGCDNHYAWMGAAIADDKFISMGLWVQGSGVGAGIPIIYVQGSHITPQSTLVTDMTVIGSGAAVWQHAKRVGRINQTNPLSNMYGYGIFAGATYCDDAYALLLDDVSLTVTPASAANSIESGGIRVDGMDWVTQPIPVGQLFRETGWLRVRYIPRHNDLDCYKFNGGTQTILMAHHAATAFVYVYWQNGLPNLLWLAIGDNTGWHGAFWNTGGGQIVTGGNYLFEVIYDLTKVILKVNGILRITIAGPIDFSAAPSTFYVGTSIYGPTDVADAVLLAP
jgi:hypothetical protein